MNDTEENLNELLQQKDVVAVTFDKFIINEFNPKKPDIPAWRVRVVSTNLKLNRSLDVTCECGSLGMGVALKALRDAGPKSS